MPDLIPSPFHRAYYLTGPTASGKTAVGVALARLLGAEVVALDSMTLYRGMDIGTAKPTPAERGGVPHHLLDVLDPWEASSVAAYRDRAGATLADLEARGVPALFVGGTPLYLKALLRGLAAIPPADPELRARLDAEDDATLHRALAAVDPASAARLHPNDRRRVIRAIEVQAATGRPLSAQQEEHDRPAEGVRVLALSRPRAELHRRIDARVVAMFDGGFLDEVRRLLASPHPLGDTARQAAGYAEAIDHLEGRLAREAAVARTQARTRQLAKRQETWFRGLAEVRPWPVAEGEPPERTAGAIRAAWESPPGT
jgi:tRNA dimethylallyltransferase